MPKVGDNQWYGGFVDHYAQLTLEQKKSITRGMNRAGHNGYLKPDTLRRNFGNYATDFMAQMVAHRFIPEMPQSAGPSPVALPGPLPPGAPAALPGPPPDGVPAAFSGPPPQGGAAAAPPAESPTRTRAREPETDDLVLEERDRMAAALSDTSREAVEARAAAAKEQQRRRDATIARADAEALMLAERRAGHAAFDRLTSERDAARQNAERDVARLTAEHDATRLNAEREAARLTAEHDATRLNAERDMARLTAEREADIAAAREDTDAQLTAYWRPRAQAAEENVRKQEARAAELEGQINHAREAIARLTREGTAQGETIAPLVSRAEMAEFYLHNVERELNRARDEASRTATEHAEALRRALARAPTSETGSGLDPGHPLGIDDATWHEVRAGLLSEELARVQGQLDASRPATAPASTSPMPQPTRAPASTSPMPPPDRAVGSTSPMPPHDRTVSSTSPMPPPARTAASTSPMPPPARTAASTSPMPQPTKDMASARGGDKPDRTAPTPDRSPAEFAPPSRAAGAPPAADRRHDQYRAQPVQHVDPEPEAQAERVDLLSTRFSRRKADPPTKVIRKAKPDNAGPRPAPKPKSSWWHSSGDAVKQASTARGLPPSRIAGASIKGMFA